MQIITNTEHIIKVRFENCLYKKVFSQWLKLIEVPELIEFDVWDIVEEKIQDEKLINKLENAFNIEIKRLLRENKLKKICSYI